MAYDKAQAKAQVKRVYKHLAGAFDDLAAAVVSFAEEEDMKRYIRANIKFAAMSAVFSIHPANLKIAFRFLVGSMDEKTIIMEAIVESATEEIMSRVEKLQKKRESHLKVVQ